MPHVASMGGGWSPRYVLHEGRWFAGHLAAVGASGGRTGDEGWPLLPGSEPRGYRSSRRALYLSLINVLKKERISMRHMFFDFAALTLLALGSCVAGDTADAIAIGPVHAVTAEP